LPSAEQSPAPSDAHEDISHPFEGFERYADIPEEEVGKVNLDAIAAAFHNLCSPCKRETRLQLIRRQLDLPTIVPIDFTAAVTVEDYEMDLSPTAEFHRDHHVLGDSDGFSEGAYEGWGNDELANPLISPYNAPPTEDGVQAMSISLTSSPIESHLHDAAPTTLSPLISLIDGDGGNLTKAVGVPTDVQLELEDGEILE
jgi:hypothetical protein